jgi:amidase
MALKDWQAIAVDKRAERDAKIPLEWKIPKDLLPDVSTKDVHSFPSESGLFTKEELEITSSTASQIVGAIAEGRLTSLEVTKALCKRAAIAQQLVNCLTEINFEEAYARAQELDEYFKLEGRTIGPLHGLPISLKDQFNIKGLDSTIGYVSYIGKPAPSNSTLSDLLLNAGAVLYTKTNVPATLMMGESVNNVFGRTCHPYNRELTSGGSSGGESALISFRGSLLGVGTDIGGSIRHPASYTGLYALRPSQGRVSYQNAVNTYVGQEAVQSAAGPMTHSVPDVRLFMKALADQKPWLVDPKILPLPWREDEEKLPEKLCFGFGMGDGTVTPSPPLRRAMEITKQKLEAAGHSVVEYTPYEHIEASELIIRMWSADGGEEFQRDTDASGEPLHPHLEAWLGKTGKVRFIIAFILFGGSYLEDHVCELWSLSTDAFHVYRVRDIVLTGTRPDHEANCVRNMADPAQENTTCAEVARTMGKDEGNHWDWSTDRWTDHAKHPIPCHSS